MAELKTQLTDKDVVEYIESVTEPGKKREDSLTFLRFMEEITGHEPRLWGTSIIGYGKYHYQSERSRQKGDWPLVGFSPREAAFSLYVYSGGEEQQRMLERLGKIKMGKACIYVKKWEDIDPEVLASMIRSTIRILKERYGDQED